MFAWLRYDRVKFAINKENGLLQLLTSKLGIEIRRSSWNNMLTQKWKRNGISKPNMVPKAGLVYYLKKHNSSFYQCVDMTIGRSIKWVGNIVDFMR